MSKFKWYNKIIYISIAGAIGYWAAESVASYFLLKQGSLINHFFPSDIHELYMRAIVFIVIVVIGVVVRNTTKKSIADADRIEHLNRILSSIGDVNQLIVREENVDRLLQQTCDIMVGGRGYYNCWIATVDKKGSFNQVYGAGLKLDTDKLLEHLRGGNVPNCLENIKDKKLWAAGETEKECSHCLLAKGYSGRGALCAPLKRKKTYGYMVVSIVREFVNDKEERALFLEVAGDIALALENIELEESERKTEKVLMQTAQKFVDLFDSINDAVFIHDLEGNFLAVNDQACERLGYSKKEFNQLTPADIDSPEFASQVGERIEQLKKDGQVFFESAHISKTGETIPVELNSRIIEYEGKKAILTVARDITERKKAQEKINRLVFYDPLTGLPNRRLFHDRIEIALGNAQRNQKQVAVAMLDIDDFKDVNDSKGHTAGDELLIKAAKKLSSAVRKTDTVARLGGDEFVCLFNNIDNLDGVKKIAKKIIGLMNEPVIIDSKKIKATISMGVALYPEDGKTGEELVKKADIALYRIKGAGKNDFAFYNSKP